MSVYDIDEMAAYIQQAAKARNIDPAIALRVARSEGLARGVWQSNVRNKAGLREPSYGPFQMLEGGGKSGFPTGLGNAFERATGLEVSDPANARATVDFALNEAAKGGWSPWYGAKAAGIDRWEGIRGAKPIALDMKPSTDSLFAARPALGETPLDITNGRMVPPIEPPSIGSGIGEAIASAAGAGAGEAAAAAALPATPGMGLMSFLGSAGKMMGGGKGRGGPSPITPSSIGADDGGARFAAAASLMQQLMANKKSPGLMLG